MKNGIMFYIKKFRLHIIVIEVLWLFFITTQIVDSMIVDNEPLFSLSFIWYSVLTFIVPLVVSILIFISSNLFEYQDAIDTVDLMNNPIMGCRILAASYAQLGQLDNARIHAQRILEAYPDFSLEQWQAMMPDKHVEDAMAFTAGLRKAGLT